MSSRRVWLMTAGLAITGAGARAAAPASSTTVWTFGDSVLDCGHYNPYGITPGQLIVRNDDALFPEFRGRDLASRGAARLMHRAVDGATVENLPAQAVGLGRPARPCVALLTVGGNDLLGGIAAGGQAEVDRFERQLQAFLETLPIRPVLVGTVYDPTFGDDRRNFLALPPALVRVQHRRINDVLRRAGRRYGRTVDLHEHFLHGSEDWFVRTIEPSLRGASEIRRAFLAAL